MPRWLAGVCAAVCLQVGCASFDVMSLDAGPAGSETGGDGAPTDPGADSAPDRPQIISAEIPVGAGWVDTGLPLTSGEHVRVTAEGAVQFDESVTPVGPDGTSEESWRAWNIVLCVNHAALIGRVGADGEPFLIGEEALFAAAEDGDLFLGLNDTKLIDNSGVGFTATIEADVDYQAITTGPVTVAGTATWTDTGIDVVTANQLTVSASGNVLVSASTGCDPAGVPDSSAYDANDVMVCANHAALIARVGPSGDAFLVGRSESVAAPASGRVYLGVNDIDVGNNSGAFAASVTVTDPDP